MEHAPQHETAMYAYCCQLRMQAQCGQARYDFKRRVNIGTNVEKEKQCNINKAFQELILVNGLH